MYTINFTNNNKNPIIVLDNSLNNETSLTLFGRDSVNWAYYLNTNLLHLCENFCGDYPPGYNNQILEGQLWFDSFNDQLKLYTGTEWDVISNIESPPITNYVTDDILTNKLTDYVLIIGNTREMDYLLLDNLTDTSRADLLANKQYVLNKICHCANQTSSDLSNFVKLTGGTKNGSILLPDETTDSSYAATKKYLENNIKLNISTKTDTVTASVSISNINYTEINDTILINGSVTLNVGITECILTLPTITNMTISYSGHGTTFSDAYCIIDSTSQVTIRRTTSTAIEKITFNISGIK